MHRAKELQEAAVDPMQFDTLLSVFQRPETFNTTPSEKASANRFAKRVLPEIRHQQNDDSFYFTLKDSIEGYPQPCLIVSEGGQIVALNEPAYTVFDLEISDRIDESGLETSDATPLSIKINAIINAKGESNEKSFCRVYYKDANRPITLAIIPNRSPDKSTKTALVFFVDIGWDGAIGNYISNAYNLTQSEQEILEMFILGDNLEQIALDRGRSFKTVRTQFYSALGKCGLSSQVDLVREVVAGSLFQSLLPHVVNTTEHPHRKELKMLRPKGRTLEVVMSGDFEGTPVILLASMGVQKFAPVKERKLFEASICVYSISPPGYGHTSPHSENEDRLNCLFEDVASFLDQLDLKTAPFVSFATSIIPTLRLAHRMPDRMSGILSFVTIPPSPYQKRNGTGGTVSVVAAIGNAMLVSPTMKNLINSSAVRAWSILGTRKMAKIQSMSEPEVAPYLLEPETIKSIDEGFKSSILQGFSQVIQDTEAIHSDWRADVDACEVPITVVHGRNDNTTNISIVKGFADDYADKIELIEIEDAGSFMHVTHEDLYIKLLKEFTQKPMIERLKNNSF
jgi:pimeloyl-ACP methyl ester carboxylesterase/DNA-binding CsgD family transcriptional regulator